MKVLINSADQLGSLLNRYNRMDFVFEFSNLSKEENQIWLEKIRKNYFECGCSLGRKFTLYAISVIAACLFFTWFFQKDKFSFMIYLYSVLFIFLMAGLGKGVGKFLAYRNLKKDIDQLKIHLQWLKV